MKDPYEVLGISSGASSDEIKSAYRKKAKEYHPDLHPDDPSAAEKMNEVNEAYDILSDPEKLAAYRAGAYDPPKQGAAYGPSDPFASYGRTGTYSQYTSYKDCGAYGQYGQNGQYGQYDGSGQGNTGQNGNPYGSYENPYGRRQGSYYSGGPYGRQDYGQYRRQRRVYIWPFDMFGRLGRIFLWYVVIKAVLRAFFRFMYFM